MFATKLPFPLISKVGTYVAAPQTCEYGSVRKWTGQGWRFGI